MSEIISVKEYREILKNQSNTRGNKRVSIDGYTFDSQAEADRYGQLRLSQQGCAISRLEVHRVFLLQESFKVNGRTYRAISYEADFSYLENGVLVCEDVKGHRTEVFKLKEKLFRFRYPDIDFRVLDINERGRR